MSSGFSAGNFCLVRFSIASFRNKNVQRCNYYFIFIHWHRKANGRIYGNNVHKFFLKNGRADY